MPTTVMQAKAAEDSRTPRRWREFEGLSASARLWSAAVLCRFGFPLALALCAEVWLNAAAPTLDAIYPPGGERGATNLVTFSGKFDPWPPRVWTDAPGLSFRATTNKGKFDLSISAEVKPGPRFVRVFNDEGVSDSRIFVIGAGREISDTESNDHFQRPQLIESLPVTINGRLDKSGDVDSFAIVLRSGQRLTASVDSQTLMSKLDAVLRLVTTNGQQLAFNHDFATLDPRLTWQAPCDQNVVLQIFGFPYPATSDVRLYGGESAIYRLHLGWDETPSSRDLSDIETLTPPFTLKGIIEKPGEEDRFRFVARDNVFISVRVAAAMNGSPLDGWVKIEDDNGKQLAHNDDSEGSRDPSLEWKAPTNGTFTVAVGSLTYEGAKNYTYDLTVEEAAPGFRARLSASSLLIGADSTNSVKLNVKRLRGHTNDLIVKVTGLPPGITATATNVSSAGGDISLPLVASIDAAPFQGPIDVLVTDVVTEQQHRALFPLTSRTEDNGVPGGYGRLLIDAVDHLWLTVRLKSEEAPKTTASAK